MKTTRKFENLECWKNSRTLCKLLFDFIKHSEFAKDYRFKSQILASAGSVMDNIAEGHNRGGNKEFIQFLYVARGSISETKSQIYRAYDFKYFTAQQFEELITKSQLIAAQITGLINHLKKSDYQGIKYKQ